MASKRRLFINISELDPSSAFVKSFTETSAANPIVMAQSDSFTLQLHFLAVNPIPTPGRPFIYVDPADWIGAKFAMGSIGAIPNGGTFTVTSSVSGTTGGIAYNASAATVQTAVQALGGMGAATVTSTVTGSWNIDSNSATASPVVDLTGSAIALAPDGSTVVIIKTQTANGSLTNRWIIQVRKALPVLNTTWTGLDLANVDVTIVQHGSATANKVFRVVWNADAYYGGVLLAFFDGTNTFTLGPIAYNAQASDVVAAFTATGAGNSVSVVQNNAGDFTISCTGTGIQLSDDPTLDTSSNTLIVPVGYEGTVTASTAGVGDLLAGANTVTTTCEVEIRQDVDQPQTVAQITNAVFIADLISNSPGFQTGSEDFATIPDVRAIAAHTFANTTARNADVPERDGQLGFQIDTQQLWHSNGTSAGDWQQTIQIGALRVGNSGVADGVLTIYGGGAGAQFGSIVASPLTSIRSWNLPDASGTIALTGSTTSSAYVAKTSGYTVTATDSTIDCTTGSFTITLLTAVGITGQTFTVKNSGSGTITINTTSSQTIDGLASGAITLSPGVAMTVQSTGANWIRI